MKKLLALAAFAAIPALSLAQLTALPAESGSITGADVDTALSPGGSATGDFRGVAFDASTGNIILPSDDGNRVVIIESTDSSFTPIATIENAVTDNGTVDPYQAKVSDDGQIFIQSFNGGILRVGSVATARPGLTSSNTPDIAGGGTSRGFGLTGDHAAGTLVIATSVGTNITIHTQTAAGADTYNSGTPIDSTSVGSGELESLFFTNSAGTLYAMNNGGILNRFNGGPGSFVLDTDYQTSATASAIGGFRAGLDIDEADDYTIGVLDSGGSSTLFAELYTDISDPDNFAEVGAETFTQVGNNNSGGAAIDDANDVVYIAGGDVLYRLGTPPASIDEWNMFDQ